MDRFRQVTVLAALAILVIAVGFGLTILDPFGGGSVSVPADRATVTVVDAQSNTSLGSVTARVSETPGERYTGLSNTDALAEDEGMLFVYRSTRPRAFVMRNMSFPLDIVFIHGNGTIAAIHHAPVPPSGTTESELTRYRGDARYVLEVNRGWTTARDVTVGDRVAVEYGANLTLTAPG